MWDFNKHPDQRVEHSSWGLLCGVPVCCSAQTARVITERIGESPEHQAVMIAEARLKLAAATGSGKNALIDGQFLVFDNLATQYADACAALRRYTTNVINEIMADEHVEYEKRSKAVEQKERPQ